MRKLLLLSVATGLLLLPAQRLQAADDAQTILDKAIQAHGGLKNLSKITAGRTKSKGKLYVSGLTLDFTQDAGYQRPDKLRSTLAMTVMGKEVVITTVFNGDKGWYKINGETKELDDKQMKEAKEELFAGQVMLLAGLKDKNVTLSPLGEVQIEGKPTVGLKISSKGHRDINIFFDKKTNLALKVERRAVDPMSGNEYTDIKIVSDYKEVGGIKSPSKVVNYHDDAKFLEAEVTEVKFADKLDDSEFVKP